MRFIIKLGIEAATYFVVGSMGTAVGSAIYHWGCDATDNLMNKLKGGTDEAEEAKS